MSMDLVLRLYFCMCLCEFVSVIMCAYVLVLAFKICVYVCACMSRGCIFLHAYISLSFNSRLQRAQIRKLLPRQREYQNWWYFYTQRK